AGLRAGWRRARRGGGGGAGLLVAPRSRDGVAGGGGGAFAASAQGRRNRARLVGGLPELGPGGARRTVGADSLRGPRARRGGEDPRVDRVCGVTAGDCGRPAASSSSAAARNNRGERASAGARGTLGSGRRPPTGLRG